VTVLAVVMLLVGCLGNPTGAPQDATGYRNDGGGSGNGVPGADGSPGGNYSGGDAVTASGRLTSQFIDVSGVTSVAAGASFVVRVTMGEPEQATVRFDDNLTGLIEASVTGDQLRLQLKPGAQVRNATLNAEVTLRRLDRLTTGGASQVTFVSAPTGPTLALLARGASRLTGPVAVDQMQATVSGSAVLTLSGQVRELGLSASGSGRMELAELAVRDLDAELSGASEATVTVSDTLAAQTSGASVLRYRGSPNITRQRSAGASSIRPE
jgi:hypothetical protein